MSDVLTSGARFGDFTVEELIGRGGMGLVYRAIQGGLDRQVALKIIAPHLASDPVFVDRFRREARRAAAIDHPAIIPIYAAGETDGRPYLAMRYVRGTDLRTLIDNQGRLAPKRALSIAYQIGGALDAAHAGGLVHRDVKPANMLIEPATGGHERAYLTDFGLTRGQTDTRLTETGSWLGTIDYMPPEQFQGGDIDGRADQYALACVTYEMLTGSAPFSREVDLAAMYAHLHSSPPRLTDALRDLPAATDEVLARAMAKQAGDRYDSCAEFVGALDRAANPHPGTLTVDPLPPPPAEATVVDPPRRAWLPNPPAPLAAEASDRADAPGHITPEPAAPQRFADAPAWPPAAAAALPPAPQPQPAYQPAGYPGSGPANSSSDPAGSARRPSTSRRKLMLGGAATAIVVVIVVLVVALAGSGGSHHRDTLAGNGAGTGRADTSGAGATATGAGTATTSAASTFPPTTATGLVALAGSAPTGAVTYDVDTDNKKVATEAVAFDRSEFRVSFSFFPGETEEYLVRRGSPVPIWFCVDTFGEWDCAAGARMSADDRSDVGFWSKISGVVTNHGALASAFGSAVARGPSVTRAREANDQVACISTTISTDEGYDMCTTASGLITQLYASGSSEYSSLRATRTSTEPPPDAFTAPARY